MDKVIVEVINKIKSLFPLNAELENINNNCIRISWRLNVSTANEKSSKIIKLIIPDEFIEDYPNHKPDREKEIILDKLVEWMKEKYQNFDPFHTRYKYDNPPEERWIIPSIAKLMLDD